MATLCVNNLHPEVNEAILFEKFFSCGPVVSIRLFRDEVSRHSLGYAYVTFQQLHDAERAMNTMNFDTLKGHAIKISRLFDGCVVIKNLERSIDREAHHANFSQFGDILSCKFDDGLEGNGFVQFASKEAANQCIEKVNGMLLLGRKVSVEHFTPSDENITQVDEVDDKQSNVFIKNFGDELDDAKLEAMFEKFGKIKSAKVMVDSNNKSKGFGFVSFKEPEAAKKAVQAVHKSQINGRVLYCDYFQKKAIRLAKLGEKMESSNNRQGVNLYVKNLDLEFDDEKLRELFSKFGTITSAKVMCEGGRSKQFGFVCFSSPEEATKAMTEMNGRIYGMRPLYVGLAQGKKERRAFLESQQLERRQVSIYNSGGGGFFVPRLHQTRGFLVPANRPAIRPPCTNMPSIRPPCTNMPSIRPPCTSMPSMRPPCTNMPSIRPPCTNMPSIRPPCTNMPSMRPPCTPQGANVRPGGVAGNWPMAGQVLPRLPNSQAQLRPYPGNLRPGIDPSVAMAPGMAQPRTAAETQNKQSVVVRDEDLLTATILATAPPQEQKQMLGERLFKIIQVHHPDLAGKITGMLLENDNSELLFMLGSQETLMMRVEEAIEVLCVKGKCPNQEDPKEVTEKMNSPIVKSALEIDISEKCIKRAIAKRLSENGGDFDTTEALIDAVFSLDQFDSDGEDEGEEKSEASGGPSSESQAEAPSSSASDDKANKGSKAEADTTRLMEEIRHLKEQRLCKICMDEDVCIAFRPCGHLVSCGTCAPALKICPICRGKIMDTVLTFLS